MSRDAQVWEVFVLMAAVALSLGFLMWTTIPPEGDPRLLNRPTAFVE